MSDKQLTVAELLARAGRETEGRETPRRRRRSLEEGGISVAELTGSIPAVKEKPAESKHSSVPIDGPEPQKVSGKEPETEQPESRPEPEAEPEQEVEPEAEAATEAELESEPEEEAAEESAPTPATDQTVVLGRVEAGLPEPEGESAPEQTGVIAPVDGDEGAEAEDGGVDKQPAEEDAPEAEERTSVTGVVLMTAIGVVLGVIIFKGFEMMWGNFSRPLVAVLALLVTAGMVGVVKALRTANDALSMVLAGLVGLLMTFGPLAIVML